MKRAAAALAVLLVAPPVGAAPDASYGRIRGDLGVAGAGTVTTGPGAARVGGDLRLRYLSTAGVFGTFEQGFAGAEPARTLAFGVELRPLFVSRWALGYEFGYARPDMLLDSFALEMGVAFLQPGGRRALQTGIGVELPLFADATGPFIGVHGGLRWSEDALAGHDGGAGYVALTLGWQQIVTGHLVDDFGWRER